jgi:uncharacterized protein (DUF2235 family)
MSRNLVLCFDGTNNKYNAANTNVVRLFQMLVRDDPAQIVYYQPGIGTMMPIGRFDRLRKKVIRIVDLVMANLLDDHVKGGYRFLMQNYEPGDRIFLFGFSRGAYTARVLAGMLHKVGLLARNNDELIPFAWDMFANTPVNDVSRGFRATFSRDVPIHFLGLWDTVSAISWAWRGKVYPFTKNNPSVEIVRHAMALDERRQRFAQNAWTDQPPSTQSVKEVWFPGVHSDVGGGYPEAESGLSKISLKWMVDELHETDILLNEDAVIKMLPPNEASNYPQSKKHESLTFWWWPVEFILLPHKDPDDRYKEHWSFHLGHLRKVPAKQHLHRSIFDRKRFDPQYQPTEHTNIPADYVTEPEDLTEAANGMTGRHKLAEHDGDLD